MQKEPRLILVGAGPGDPGLFTLKGVEVLGKADVVLHDALAHPEILKHANPNAELIFVGKLKGVHDNKQVDINDLIVKKAKEKGTVVRLKGGDPFIFGRGYEELEIASANGLKVGVVPGVSSCYSVPEIAGIPLTRKGVSESFRVVTATTKDRLLSNDVLESVKSNATLVILMGMHKLSEIIEVYKNEGKSDLPIAIIERGSWESEKRVLGTIETIEELVTKGNVSSPAIMVLGHVASHMKV